MTAANLTADRGRHGNPTLSGTQYSDDANADLLSRIPANANTVLDVGCGTGALGAAYREVNPNARLFGIERDSKAAAIARQRLDVVACVDVEHSPLPFELPEGIDCLIYGDILQQLRDPSAVLARQLDALNRNGTVLVCVPNAEHWSMMARLLRGTWDYERAGLFDIRHLRWFSLRTLARTLTEAGLTVEEVYPRVLAAEHAQQVVRALTPSLQHFGIDPQEYLRRAVPLQYVVCARRVEYDTAAASPSKVIENQLPSRDSDEVKSGRISYMPGRSLTIRDLAPLIDSADADKWSAAGLKAVDVFANGGQYQRRAARILSPRADVEAYHQRRYDARVQEYPPIYRAVFTDAMVTGQGTLILRDSSLINDSCWEVFAQGGIPQGLHRSPNGDLVQSMQPSRRIDMPCLLLKRPYWRNYGHWLVDSAALLALIPALAMPREWQIVIGGLHDARMRDIVHETLAILNPGVPVIEHSDNESWEFAELHYVMPLSRTPLFKLPQGLAVLRSLFLASIKSRSHGKKIFIDRGPEWKRRLENETELRSICERAGFEFVKPEELSLRAQAELFNSAEVIVGVKGAALTNLMFCTSKASVVVLSPDNWGDQFFWDIAGQVGLKYVEILGPVLDAAEGPRTSSFRVDRDLFITALMEASGSGMVNIADTVTSVPAPSRATEDSAETPRKSGGELQAPIVSTDTRFVSRPTSSLTVTVDLQKLRDTPNSRALLAPLGSMAMPPCYVMNPPLTWQNASNRSGTIRDPLPISNTPYNHLFPQQMPYPEMWLARLDDVYYLQYGAPFLPGPKILINDYIVPWGPSAVGWFRYEGENTYRLPIDLTEAYPVDKAFFMGHPISGHFGHFIGDCLSRMHAWQTCRELFGDVKIILDHSKHNTRFRDELLAAAGVNPRDIVFAQGAVHCRELMLGSTALGVSRYASPTSAILWQQVCDALADRDAGRGEQVYFSRSAQSARKLKNEDEVEDLFRSYGFTIVCPESLSMKEQISVVSNAGLIAGPAGSAMFNLAFQKQLKSVLILLPETFVQITEWLFLAGSTCPIYYHIGLRDMPPGLPSSVGDAWRVDVPQLASDIASWLSRV